MRAAVVDAPGGPDVLEVRPVSMPVALPGKVLIRVRAFGLNRSQLHFRSGVAYTGSFPRNPAIAVLAKLRGMTVYSTTRRAAGRALLESVGVDHVLIDDGQVADQVRLVSPSGVDAAVELVGVNVMKDSLRGVRTDGTECFTGMLSDQ
jgi:NADPH:quinone reductase-like Zn-dependent oxidoreductase